MTKKKDPMHVAYRRLPKATRGQVADFYMLVKSGFFANRPFEQEVMEKIIFAMQTIGRIK